jgi:hypothetical protein
MEERNMNVVDRIIAYEEGRLNFRATIELFSQLIKTGQAWSLQGSYGRTAAGLLDDGIIDENGEINEDRYSVLVRSL